MQGFHVNIEEETVKNKSFRKVVYTSRYMQLVYMCLKPGESIGLETHGNDQFFRFEKGEGEVVIDGSQYHVEDGSGVVVPAGSKHNVTNTSETDELQLYTIYAVPHHQKDVEHVTKAEAEAEASHEEFDGITSE